ncbi:MAG: hypothetical protein K2O89_05735 [Clostridia bacterium]|nr:hypothetical protein [Clostridia bacterium]
MKYLKVALAVLTTLICVLSSSTVTAKADTAFRYAYVGEKVEAYFYKDKDLQSALFAIPETYCVEILREDGDWYYCRYAKDEGAYVALRGYCLKSDLNPIEEPLENEYLNYPIAVDFYAKEGSAQIDPFKVTLTVAFYGNGTMNASGLSYVYYAGNFGYVANTVRDYPKNDIPQPTVSTDITERESVNATLITAIVITVIAVVAVVVLYFASKRPKLPPKLNG